MCKEKKYTGISKYLLRRLFRHMVRAKNDRRYCRLTGQEIFVGSRCVYCSNFQISELVGEKRFFPVISDSKFYTFLLIMYIKNAASRASYDSSVFNPET